MPVDTSIYERQRRGISDDYSSKSAVNAYSRFLSQQRGQRNIADYTRDFSRALPKHAAAYGRKGMAGPGVRSGVYGRAMRSYVGDYQQSLNRQLADQQTEQRQFDLTEAELTAAKDRALSDMEADKAKEIAMAASYLTALKPMYT